MPHPVGGAMGVTLHAIKGIGYTHFDHQLSGAARICLAVVL